MRARIIIIVLALSAIAAGTCSCTVAWRTRHGSAVKTAPPGRVKKMTGSQSAAPYAPGQQKKHKGEKQTRVVPVVVPVPVPVPVPADR